MKGTGAEQRLIEDNLGLVHACCRRMTGRGMDYDDLYGAGCLGLCKAAKGFDPARGLCFSTYAVPVILGEIRRLFRDGGSLRVSRTLKDLARKAARVGEELTERLGRPPAVSELALALQAPPEQVAEALCAARPVLSLTVGEEENGREYDVSVAGAEETVCDRQALYQELARLPRQERALIHLRYFEGKTQAATAALLGMTQVQVSRRERAILQKMRGAL